MNSPTLSVSCVLTIIPKMIVIVIKRMLDFPYHPLWCYQFIMYDIIKDVEKAHYNIIMLEIKEQSSHK